ncbi:MAG TPA: DUF4157 domain-containing protein [Sphingobium sp.]|nr:DUF4157 domain-containing protein [Sphingobium sp.]
MFRPLALSTALAALLAPLPSAATAPANGSPDGTALLTDAIATARDRLAQARPHYQAARDALLRNLSDATNQVASEALAQWIIASRDDVVRGGVSPIPAAIRARLAGHFPDALLDRVRYRVGIGNDLALPSHAFRANAAAITLDEVIAFRTDAGAADAYLWAHELIHVQQYQRWGVRGFARRYTLDHDGVEREAESEAARILTAMAVR